MNENLLISDTIPAGHPEPLSLAIRPCHAFYIPVPARDTVVMQENS
jgi:hypothetical protein